MVEEEFHLSSILDGSKQDIKAIAVTVANEVVSAGREENIKFFGKKRGQFDCFKELAQPPGTVINSLAYYYHSNGEWLLFAGRKNGSIVVYDKNFREINVWTHHELNVCCLHVDKHNKKLLSGSWDNNVIVWPIECMMNESFNALVCTGHSMSVWALATFENRPTFYLSGSADKTIKLWQDDNCVRTYKGHTDVIRCLQVLSNETFLSAANDSTYRIWHIESSEALRLFQSNVEEFIFSISLVGKNIVSCGETGFIEIWGIEKTDAGENLKHKQIMRTPSTTLWASGALGTDRFAVGSNDGKIYIYASDPEDKAPPEVIAAMDELLSEKMAAEILRKEQEGKEEIVIKVSLDDGAPNMELRYKKGSDPAIAAENFIKANNLPISYLNEITEYIVANIPEARQAQSKNWKKQSTQKVVVDGIAYDSKLEITLKSGVVQLPFNYTDNPTTVAIKFCEKHKLLAQSAVQFASLISQEINANRDSTVNNNSTQFYDPFTGGGRYIPGQNNNSFSMGADPYTGGGRYIPESLSTPMSNGPVGGDPFTSGGRYIPGSSHKSFTPNASRPTDKLRPVCELIPMGNYFTFEADRPPNPKAIAKLKETNELQVELRLNPEQLEAMSCLLGSQPGIAEVGELEESALDTGFSWSFNDIGIIIDLLRCALLHEKLNKYFCDVKGKGIMTRNRLFELLVSNPPPNVKVFICRALTNAFSFAEGREMISPNSEDFSKLVHQAVSCFASNGSVSRQLQLSAASVLANWSLLLLQRSQNIMELGPREDVMRAVIAGLEDVDSFGQKDETALIRMLQTIVTLMWGDKQVIQTAKNRNIATIANRLKDAVTSEIGKNVARVIIEMTYSV